MYVPFQDCCKGHRLPVSDPCRAAIKELLDVSVAFLGNVSWWLVVKVSDIHGVCAPSILVNVEQHFESNMQAEKQVKAFIAMEQDGCRIEETIAITSRI
jgi:hypothetical protein